MARLFTVLAKKQVNIVETVSCGGEHLLFVAERDLPAAVDVIHHSYLEVPQE
jgi:hypothetical protein